MPAIPILLFTVIVGCNDSLGPATVALQQNNPAQALELLEPLRTQCAQSSSFYELLGVARELAGKQAVAEESLRTAVRLDPSSSRLQTELGATLLRNGKPAEASKALDQALSLDPDNIVTLKYALGAAVGSGNWTRASRLFDRMHIESNVTLLQSEPILMMWLARTWLETSQRDRLSALLNAQRPSIPPGLLFSLGTLFAQHGLYAMAVDYLEAVPPEAADDALYFNLGLCYSHLGRFEDARERYFAAIDKHPGHIDAYFHVGLDYVTSGEPRLGLPWTYKAYELEPSRPDLVYALVEQLTDLGFFQTAEEALSRAGISGTKDPLLLVAKGDLKRARGDAMGASLDYRQASDRSPTLIPALVGLARADAALGRSAKSKVLLEKALQTDVGDPIANGELGIFEARQGDWSASLKHLERAWKLDHSNPEVAFELARAYQASGRSADALQTLLSLSPDVKSSSAFHFQLAQIYTALHRSAEAQAERELVSTLTAVSPEALHFDAPRTYIP